MGKSKDRILGRTFIVPIEIYYYEVVEATFTPHPTAGCMMPNEKFEIKKMYLANTQELMDWWTKRDDWNYPIPVDLQLFMNIAGMSGLYEEV